MKEGEREEVQVKRERLGREGAREGGGKGGREGAREGGRGQGKEGGGEEGREGAREEEREVWEEGGKGRVRGRSGGEEVVRQWRLGSTRLTLSIERIFSCMRVILSSPLMEAPLSLRQRGVPAPPELEYWV